MHFAPQQQCIKKVYFKSAGKFNTTCGTKGGDSGLLFAVI